MKSIKVCEYSRSRSFHYDLILQDQASGERSQDQWSSGSTLYTTLPHNLIKEKLLDLIEWTFKRALKNYGSLYLACNDRKAFFTYSDQSRYTLWS